MDIKEKEEKLFKNDVEQNYSEKKKEIGSSEKVFEENQNEDYNPSVVISTNSTKIVIYISKKVCHCKVCTN